MCPPHPTLSPSGGEGTKRTLSPSGGEETGTTPSPSWEGEGRGEGGTLDRIPSSLVLLFDVPGEAFRRILAHHGLADRVLASQRRDRQVLAALHLIEVHVHHDLVVFLPDALPADVGVVEAHAFLRLRHLVGVEALHLLRGRRPEQH